MEMQSLNKISFLLLLAMLVNMYGCTGIQSFGLTARAGDTIALGVGWRLNLSSQIDNIAVNYKVGGIDTVTNYAANDPRIRSIVNSFPDPLSNLIVGRETSQNLGNFDDSLGIAIDGAVTSLDKEWAQTFVILDLPASMDTGVATINITPTVGSPIGPISVEILAGTGSPHLFTNFESLGIGANHLTTLRRTPHYEINFQATQVPYSIQVDFTHYATVDNGGVGRAYVVNPRGDIKNISWSDDGANLRVIISPTGLQPPIWMKAFKFYIAGGITNLTESSVQGYDENGNPVAVTMSITNNN